MLVYWYLVVSDMDPRVWAHQMHAAALAQFMGLLTGYRIGGTRWSSGSSEQEDDRRKTYVRRRCGELPFITAFSCNRKSIPGSAQHLRVLCTSRAWLAYGTPGQYVQCNIVQIMVFSSTQPAPVP